MEIRCNILRKTAMAIQVETKDNRKLWIPNSVIKSKTTIVGEKYITINVEDWFAKQEDL